MRILAHKPFFVPNKRFDFFEEIILQPRKDYMTVSEFESYLQKGLGRAILLLKQEPDKTPFREAAWNHAIHDPRYDRQCNAPRGHYIKTLFGCFPGGDAMLSELFRVYGEGTADPWDLTYYINNLEEMMEDRTEGAETALDSIYRVLLKELLTLPNPLTNGCDHERDNYHFAASRRYRFHHDVLGELVRDGITLLQKSERYDITDFTDFFEHSIRVSQTEVFKTALVALEKENPACKAIIDSYRKQTHKVPKHHDAAKETSLPKPKNWREAIDFAIKTGNPRIPVKNSLWQNLSSEDAAEIARLVEEEPDSLRRSVLVSQLRRYGEELLQCYPRDPSPLIAELENNAHLTFPVSSENLLIWELSRLVAKIRHPAVRDAALRSLSYYAENHDSISYSTAMAAWMTNYLPQDASALEAFVFSITDSDILHSIGMEVRDNERIPESILLYLYEHTPCSSCRTNFFTSLLSRYEDCLNLPKNLAALREEAKFDCDYATRMTAKAETVKKAKKQ